MILDQDTKGGEKGERSTIGLVAAVTFMVLLLVAKTRSRLLSDVETISLALHEEPECLCHLSRLLLKDHGRVLDLHPGAVGRVQFTVEGDRVVDEGGESADQIEYGDLERLGVTLLVHVVLPVDLNSGPPDELLGQLGQIGRLDVLAEVMLVLAE